MSANATTTTLGALRYEFRMQARRKSVWIATLLSSLVVVTGLSNPWNASTDTSVNTVIGNWAIVCNAFMPVVFGVLLADRLPRDRRLRVTELFDSLPASSGGHLFGKYLGSAVASTLPILLVYSAGIGYVMVRWQDPMALPTAVAAFAAINIPGLLFVAAFSIAVPALLWVPLYQFLFVGYWFWGNLLTPSYGIPTLSTTVLTPLGGNAANAFFGVDPIMGQHPDAMHGIVSILVLLSVASLVLLVGNTYLNWRRARV